MRGGFFLCPFAVVRFAGAWWGFLQIPARGGMVFVAKFGCFTQQNWSFVAVASMFLQMTTFYARNKRFLNPVYGFLQKKREQAFGLLFVVWLLFFLYT